MSPAHGNDPPATIAAVGGGGALRPSRRALSSLEGLAGQRAARVQEWAGNSFPRLADEPRRLEAELERFLQAPGHRDLVSAFAAFDGADMHPERLTPELEKALEGFLSVRGGEKAGYDSSSGLSGSSSDSESDPSADNRPPAVSRHRHAGSTPRAGRGSRDRKSVV